MPETSEKSKGELIKDAWDNWFLSDYSWENLHQKYCQDETTTLKDYWLNGSSEDRLRENGELIEAEGQKTYHLVHLPIKYEDGTNTCKALNFSAAKSKIDKLIFLRLKQDSNDSNIQKIKAEFQGAIFLELNLGEGNFEHPINANFENSIFTRTVNFDNAEFIEKTDFTDTTFIGDAIFNESKFNNTATFERTVFLSKSDFSDSNFLNTVNFENTIFLSEALFSKAEFTQNVTFDNTTFLEKSLFSHTIWEAESFLKNCKFTKDTSFSFAIYKGPTLFSRSIFSGEVDFKKVKFAKEVNFCKTRFEKAAHFNSVTWPSNSDEQADDLKETGRFSMTIFCDQADFSDSSLDAFAAFDRAQFRGGLTLDRIGDAVSDVQFIKELEECRVIKKHEKREQRLKELEGGCRTIKQEMANQSDKHRENLFYKYELISKRYQSDTTFFEKITSKIYYLLSDYGSSISKPILFILITWFLFTIIYLSFYPYCDKMENLISSSSVSLNRMLPFGALGDFNVGFTTKLKEKHNSTIDFLFMFFATIESICSTILIFLLALSIRRRFQIN